MSKRKDTGKGSIANIKTLIITNIELTRTLIIHVVLRVAQLGII